MFSKKSFAGIFGILMAISMVGFAQQAAPTPSTNQKELRRERSELREKRREGRREHMKMRGHRGPGFMRDLNLSDAQREQVRAISQRRLEATKGQREELFKMREKRIAGTFDAADEARVKALRQEMRLAMEGIRGETEAVLTAEQKTRLEQLKTERKARHEEHKGERKLRMEQRKEGRGRSHKTIL